MFDNLICGSGKRDYALVSGGQASTSKVRLILRINFVLSIR
jgi:hypothetical protein